MKKIPLILIVFFLTGFSSPNLKESNYLVGDVSIKFLLKQNPAFYSEYESYKVDDQFELLGVKDLDVIIVFGTWCHDSKREVPRMLRILDSIGMSFEKISLIAVDIRKSEPGGRGKLFNIKRTPTFIFFKEGDEVGRIIERPDVNLESDLKKISI